MNNTLSTRTLTSLENELSDYYTNNNSDFFWIICVIACAFCFIGVGELIKVPVGFKILLFILGAIAGIFVAGFIVQKLTPDNIKEIEQEIEERKKLTIQWNENVYVIF